MDGPGVHGVEPVGPDPDETGRLLCQVRSGDGQALDRLLTRHRDELRRAVEFRMDRAMRRRVDPSDVVQEAQAEIARRIGDFLDRSPMPFHLWLRKVAVENLLRLRRMHVEADCRAADREVVLPEQSSLLLANLVLVRVGTPGQLAAGRDLAAKLAQAMTDLADDDREVLVLRCYEGLSNGEVAQILGIDPPAASKRYGRALLRLRKHLVARGVTESQT